MSIEVAIICDDCGRLIDAAKTATAARKQIRSSDIGHDDGRRARVGLPGGRDLCWDCGPASISRDGQP